MYAFAMKDLRVPDPALLALLEAHGVDLEDLGPSGQKIIQHLLAEKRQILEDLNSVRQLADFDPLCPVFNRRAFVRELAREIEVAARHSTHLTLLYVDLDRFKRINDTHGHKVGDAVLVDVAKALKACVRQTDIVGRIGGDEFGIILVKAQVDAACRQIERLKAGLSALNGFPVQINASIGSAVWTSGQSAESLMAAADKAMFLKKTAR
ncbi:MAG: GGDEF domain-containing protein [Pseudomonadota bacterium]